ncbi:hypothetical protein BGY98DRAFT_899212, partial [Russula aff. rugulosa BPL654]
VQRTPDMYLDELRDTLATTCGVKVSDATVWRTLRRAGFTMKKVTRVAIEHSAEKRSQYIARISAYRPDQLVFVDES